MPYDTQQLAAPLIRKKKKARTRTVEGRGNAIQPMTKPVRDMSKSRLQGGDNEGFGQYIASLSRYQRNEKSRGRQSKQFAAEDLARSRIKPIADPEAGQSERRRKAARRRMRGRLGTLLSQRETLG